MMFDPDSASTCTINIAKLVPSVRFELTLHGF